jgi:hypothetical protein
MKDFAKHIRVARWLLWLAAMASFGCVIPTALVDEPAEVNSRPVFSSADPPFGPLPATAGQLTELKLGAQDPNPDPVTNKLYVRLFKLGTTGPTSRIYLGDATDLDYPPGADIVHQPLTPLTGSFFGPSGIDLCGAFGDGIELFVVVADRQFSIQPGQETSAPGGLTDENHWELSCK